MSDEEYRLREMKLVPISPDLYCPLCRRRLVKMHPERGTFDLASKAGVWMSSSVDPYNLPEEDEIEGFLEAICMRRRCRFRRWWEGLPRREKIMDCVTIVLVVTLVSLALIQDGWRGVIPW